LKALFQVHVLFLLKCPIDIVSRRSQMMRILSNLHQPQ
jgi:hypothetical protein